MTIETQLWAHPACESEVQRLLHEPGTPAKSWISRTFAILDELVDRCRKAGPGTDVLADFRPHTLARAEVTPSLLAWPDTPEGREFAAGESLNLGLLQIGRLRSAVAVLECPDEIFVVWLGAEVTAAPRDDGFVDDEDATLAEQALLGQLNAVVDLTWLEQE